MVVLNEPEHVLVQFADSSYRWIDAKRFSWNGAGDDRDVLSTLILNRHYRDTYISPDSHEHDAKTVHGPYTVAKITPADFEGMLPTDAKAIVEEFIGLDDSPPRPRCFGRSKH